MNRGTGLKSYTPLVRKTPLAQVGRKRAGTALKPKRPQPAVPADLRTALATRSAGWCEMALTGCTRIAVDPAHRLGRKAGGRKRAGRERIDRLSAVLHACRACHEWTHARLADAYELGLMVREYQVPAQEPVVYRGVLVFLADDGSVIPFEEAA